MTQILTACKGAGERCVGAVPPDSNSVNTKSSTHLWLFHVLRGAEKVQERREEVEARGKLVLEQMTQDGSN